VALSWCCLEVWLLRLIVCYVLCCCLMMFVVVCCRRVKIGLPGSKLRRRVTGGGREEIRGYSAPNE
jgi:hypothetical protein